MLNPFIYVRPQQEKVILLFLSFTSGVEEVIEFTTNSVIEKLLSTLLNGSIYTKCKNLKVKRVIFKITKT